MWLHLCPGSPGSAGYLSSWGGGGRRKEPQEHANACPGGEIKRYLSVQETRHTSFYTEVASCACCATLESTAQENSPKTAGTTTNSLFSFFVCSKYFKYITYESWTPSFTVLLHFQHGNSLFFTEAEMKPILLFYFYFLYMLKVPVDLLLPFRDWAVGTADSLFQLQHLFWDVMPRWTVKSGQLPLTILWSFSPIPACCPHVICSPRWIPFSAGCTVLLQYSTI